MHVDTGLLHSGGDESRRAGSHADDGANHLTRTSPAAGMFGDFDAAETFHEAIAQAHTQHATTLRAHGETLNSVGDKAHTAATAFTEMDKHNAAELKAVRCNSST
jgi:hypothetical protein